jgi:opacity protein-like surface antigen
MELNHMKKICLLAAAVSVFALNANAANWNNNEIFKPYIGADYVYSQAKVGGQAKHAKKDYNSWMVNVGTDIAHYTSVEAFFQQSGDRKNRLPSENITSKFYAWGLDFYGRMPIDCTGFNLLGSLGAANYNTKFEYKPGGSIDKQRVGYRAGIGFSYDFTNNMSMRVMGRYSYVGMRDFNHLMEVTAGLRYTF